MSMKKSRMSKLIHARKLIIPDSFEMHLPNDYDETFQNGYFHFNIEKLLPYVVKYKNELLQVSVAVSDWRKDNVPDDEYIELADLARPILIAEIAPDRLEYYPDIDPADWQTRGYSLIDGHHRIEKAYRYGVEQLPAYILPMEHHIGFMFKGFKEYAHYWNGKLLDYENDMKRRQRIVELP
jgi:hypothetical protein